MFNKQMSTWEKIVVFSYAYFLILMILFRPISYMVTQFQNKYSIVSTICHMAFQFNYICVVIIVLTSVRVVLIWDIVALGTLLAGGIVLTNVFHPENNGYLSQIYFGLLYAFLSYNLIRRMYIDYISLIEILIKVCRIVSIGIIIILVVIFKFSTGGEYMNYADAATVVSAILLYSGFVKNNKFDKYWGGVIALSILCFGSRGAFLALVILLLLFFVFDSRNNTKKIFVVYLGVFFLFLIMAFENQILQMIASIVEKLGLKSRTIMALLNGDLLNDSARSDIYIYLMEILFSKNRWIAGIGLCGDRYFLPLQFSGTNVAYVHNLFLELILDFGVPLGVFISIYLVKCILFDFILNRKVVYEMKSFISIFFVISFVQLISSRSYLTETTFFILFALIKNIKEGDYGYETNCECNYSDI